MSSVSIAAPSVRRAAKIPPESDASDRPWQPSQIFAASVLFGPAACGVVAGINFRRLGQPQLAGLSIAAGLGAFLILALVLVHASGSAAQPIGLITNFAVGGAFQAGQRGAFDDWKTRHWKPTTPNERYRSTRVGLLFLVGAAALAAEIGIMFLAIG